MKRNLVRLKHFINDPDKKPFFKIIKEVFKLWVLKKAFPLHYFGRFFYRTNAPKNINDYMSIQEYNRINETVVAKNLESPTVFSILDNKLFLFYFCRDNNIRTPEVISYNLKDNFYLNDKIHSVKTKADFVDFFLKVFNLLNIKKLFLKPIQGHGGFGAIMLTMEKLNNNAQDVFEALKDCSYIHQEVVVQHKEINAIYSKSINTIRLETFRNKKGSIHFLGSFMRFGSKGVEVDNANRGGIRVFVNTEDGTLFKNGTTKLIHGGEKSTKHPDSGFVFEDYKIPYFTEALNLVEHLAKILPCYVHGWDIAITNSGPIVIEGNCSPGLFGTEGSYHGYKNKPVFKEILKDTKAYHKTKR